MFHRLKALWELSGLLADKEQKPQVLERFLRGKKAIIVDTAPPIFDNPDKYV